jgi:hypothetical protein
VIRNGLLQHIAGESTCGFVYNLDMNVGRAAEARVAVWNFVTDWAFCFRVEKNFKGAGQSLHPAVGTDL